MVFKVSSLAPGARKYIDIGKVANNMLIDVYKITYYMIFRPNLFVRIFQFFDDFLALRWI